MRLESEAEALFAETERVCVSVPREHLKDLKPRTQKSMFFAPKNGAAKAQIQKLRQKSKMLKPDEVVQKEEFEQAEIRRWKSPDRSRMITVLASLPHFNPMMNKGSGSTASTNEVTQFGLAGAGASLMAIEPAAGGILLMFSCIFQAMTSEAEEEPDKTEETSENPQVEESRESGLFTAGANSMNWLLTDR